MNNAIENKYFTEDSAVIPINEGVSTLIPLNKVIPHEEIPLYKIVGKTLIIAIPMALSFTFTWSQIATAAMASRVQYFN
jgi:hypothetical protein